MQSIMASGVYVCEIVCVWRGRGLQVKMSTLKKKKEEFSEEP